MKTRRLIKRSQSKRTIKKYRKTRNIKSTRKYQKTKFKRNHRKTVKIGGDDDYEVTNSAFENMENKDSYFISKKNSPEYHLARPNATYERNSAKKNNNNPADLYSVSPEEIPSANSGLQKNITSKETREAIEKLKITIENLQNEINNLKSNKKKNKKMIEIKETQLNNLKKSLEGKEEKKEANEKEEEEERRRASERAAQRPISLGKSRYNSNENEFKHDNIKSLPDDEKQRMAEQIKIDIKNGLYINNEIINALFDPNEADELMQTRDKKVGEKYEDYQSTLMNYEPINAS
jgi:hypothetical protein